MRLCQIASELVITFIIGSTLVLSECPNLCNKRGHCDKYNVCHCNEGFEGGDCSLRKCPMELAWSDLANNKDSAHALAVCSNRGICDPSFGTCSCLQGFTGTACERLDCENSCGSNGRCFSMHDYANRFKNSDSQSLTYDSVWDSSKVTGCVCDPGFFNYQCMEQNCPVGDDPLTKNQVNELQLLKCVTAKGKFLLYFDGYPSKWISYTANAADVKSALESIPVLNDITVTFSQPTYAVCTSRTTPNIVQIQFNLNFGPLPPLVPLRDSVMIGNDGAIEISANGRKQFLDPQSSNLYTSIKGTKESDICAFRGTCSATGVCSCYNTNGDSYGSSNGYGNPGSLGDCGFIASGSTVSSCPGDVPCNTHGVCDVSSFRCHCADGWMFGDCSARTCPKGRSWFDYPFQNEKAHYKLAECSNMGTCDPVTGLCACRVNFFGNACQYMSCDAGGGGSSGQSPCSGNGACLSMSELALRSPKNDEGLRNTIYTYGVDPNNAQTWDNNRIFGCYCDEGYEGYDCSLRSCPKGDNPGTYNDHCEVQILQCKADAGYFRLKFREQSTRPIYPNSTATQFLNALQALSTLRKVNVFFTQDGPIPDGVLNTKLPSKFGVPNEYISQPSTTEVCSNSGEQLVLIQYIATAGNLPSIEPDISQLKLSLGDSGLPGSGKVLVYADGESVFNYTSIKGTTENAVCSNRGTCNYLTGVCDCFPQWTSSDGTGRLGFLGDCGAYRIT